MVVAWVVLAGVLLAVELHHLAFYAMFGALGAATAAGTAAIAPHAVFVQFAVALGVTVVALTVVRPFIHRAYERRRTRGTVARGVHGGLIGEAAITLDRVGDPAAPGHVLLLGERWLASSEGGEPIEGGVAVTVTEVRGTTLTVARLVSHTTTATATPTVTVPGGSQ